jgi:telomerase reverse transcriptase
LFYYRQEVWSEILKQGLEPLTSSTFEEIPLEKVAEILNNKTLGYSKVKFIPKDNEGNLRPIVNMKRSMHKTVSSLFNFDT